MASADQINENNKADNNPPTTGPNTGNLPFSTDNEQKHPLSQADIDRKINESTAGETGDDVRSDKYKKKDPQKKEPDRGPNFDLYSAQEDGDTSSNAGVFK